MEDDLTFPHILDGLSAPIAITTDDRRVDLANRHFLDSIGMSLDELKDWETSGAVHPDDLPRVVPHGGNRSSAASHTRSCNASGASMASIDGFRFAGCQFETQRTYCPLVRSAHRHRRPEARRGAAGRREAAPRDGRVRVSSPGRSWGDVQPCRYRRRRQRLLDLADRRGWDVSPRGRPDAPSRATMPRSTAFQSHARLDLAAPRLR